MEIGVWGDSISYGACDTEGLGWVGRMRKQYPADDRVDVYNLGICGETSEDVLKRFEIEAKAVEPNRIFLAFGANDCKFPEGSATNKIPLDVYITNMHTLITQAKTFTGDVIVIGLTIADESFKRSGSVFLNKEMRRYDEALEKLAQAEGVVYVKVSHVLDESDIADGIHPNAQGYEKMYQEIKKVIK